MGVVSRNRVVATLAIALAVGVFTLAGAQERDEWGKLCYTDPSGWRLSLTGGEVDVEEAKEICMPACGRFGSYEEMDRRLDQVGSRTGAYFSLYRKIYRDWNDEQERVAELRKRMESQGRKCDEEPLEYRYLACALDVPPPSQGKRVILTSNVTVTIGLRKKGSGHLLELTSITVLGTSDYKRQTFCWDARDGKVVAADPKKFCSKGNTILLFAMFPAVFRTEDIEEVRASGFQVVDGQPSRVESQ